MFSHAFVAELVEIIPMRFDCNAQGNWLVSPRELAAKLGISSTRLQEEEALGLVRSRVEIGRGENEGCSRVTVQTREAIWEGLFDQQGALISERWLD